MAITKEYIIIEEVEIDFLAKNPAPIVICPQFEDRGRAIKVKLKNGGEDFAIEEGLSPYVYESKFDGKVVGNPCEYEGNVVMIEITRQMAFVSGNNLLRVALVREEDGAVAQTMHIVLKVISGPNIEDAERSTDEFKALKEYVTEAGQYAAQAEQSKQSAAQSEQNAEASKTAAQAALQGALEAEDRVQAIVAGNEAYTKQQSHDLFAAALVTKTGPAASLEVYSDKLSNLKVYANGFTTQSGSGDPSPVNVRKLTCGGLKLVEVTFDGSPDEDWDISGGSTTGTSGSKQFFIPVPIPAYNTSYDSVPIGYCNRLTSVTPNDTYYARGGENTYSTINSSVLVRLEGVGTEEALRAVLAADPITVWYRPADESQATGLYVPIQVQGGEYIATCLKLTKELCEGDSVVNWVKSECDKVVTFDGSSDENWKLSGSPVSGYIKAYIAVSDVVINTALSNWLKKGNFLADWLANASREYVTSSDSGNICVQIKTDNGNTVENLRNILAANPLTVWYQTIHYTEIDDIPVSLEVHARSSDVFNGTENFGYGSSAKTLYVNLPLAKPSQVGSLKCSAFKSVFPTSGNFNCYMDSSKNLIITGYDSLAAGKTAIQNLYAAGTPFQVEYELATQQVYAHTAVRLPAYPDDTGKVTITGQSGGTVTVVFNKSIAKAFEEMVQRVSALELNALRG